MTHHDDSEEQVREALEALCCHRCGCDEKTMCLAYDLAPRVLAALRAASRSTAWEDAALPAALAALTTAAPPRPARASPRLGG